MTSPAAPAVAFRAFASLAVGMILAFVLLANLLFVTVFSLSFSTICTLTAMPSRMRFNANTVSGTV